VASPGACSIKIGALNEWFVNRVREIPLPVLGLSHARHVVFEGRASNPDDGFAGGGGGGVEGGGEPVGGGSLDRVDSPLLQPYSTDAISVTSANEFGKRCVCMKVSSEPDECNIVGQQRRMLLASLEVALEARSYG
jgi:hypothetical protein